ncbi:hypothetical protein QJS04_geneDACA011361 [Acorus gramineus]|uniref:Peptidase S26 domain-containing protein n=1 Tax=Acorus gramineus TaxID=55184 RepID=A0AAV9AMQ1_ACOGR|nr:hypothetical protein QJS04_geneDACA011361 [Acorus gramineus]
MGAWNAVWQNTKRICTFGLIAVTVNDRYATFARVQGSAAHSAIAPGTTDTSAGLSGDVVFVEKICLEKLNFSRGDVVVYRSCRKPNQTCVMRLTALPGDWIPVPESNETLKIPMGHCWVESDIPVPGAESSEMLQISLAIVRGRATHRVWPLNKFGKIERSTIVRRALHHR